MATKAKTNTIQTDEAAALNYDGSDISDRRRLPGARLKSVDNILTPVKRKRLVANTRDIQQNFSIAAWAIRRHLDYVSTFTFQPVSGDRVIDKQLAALMRWYNRPHNCDAAGRHSLASIIRLSEERRTVDGDVFLVKLRDGRLQAIESDRIRDPDTTPKTDLNKWVHGVRVNRAGRPAAFAIHNRNPDGSYTYERSVRARNVYQLGYFDRFDQVRGVSPLAPAINTFRDLYESFDYTLAKAKVSAMFGLVLSREATDGWPEVSADDDVTGGYNVDFGKGPVLLDLDPGDKAEFIEAKTPSPEFQSFTNTMISASLKALDIPFSFYDEGYTNFFGSRSAFIHYDKAAKQKQAHLVDLLDRITAWRVSLWIADGMLKLPAGRSLANLRWEWVAAGTPWWNPSQEINADIAAINAGLKTRSQVVRERHGKEFREVINTLAEEQLYMDAQGVAYETTPAPATDPVGTNDNDNEVADDEQ